MSKYFSIGKVVKINASEVTILIKNFINLKTIFYNGKDHMGVFVGSFVGILRDSKKIVVQITSESINNTYKSSPSSSFWEDGIQIELIAKIIGVLKKDGNYEIGVNKFPLIFDDVILLNTDEIKKIFYLSPESTLKLGKSLAYNFDVCLPYNDLFDNHIGIFGASRSGKTNTLTHLYFSLFEYLKEKNEKNENKEANSKSTFVFFDLNEEFDKISEAEKKNLEEKFEDLPEILSFLEEGNKDKFKKIPKSLKEDNKGQDVSNPTNNKSQYSKELWISKLLKKFKKTPENLKENNEGQDVSNSINNKSQQFEDKYKEKFKKQLEQFLELDENKNLQILTLKFNKTNIENKKRIFLIITEILYKKQKNKENNAKDSIHLIIDEAHNILPQKEVKETNEKQILELTFLEQIVKEGRKHNFFLTISAQEPWTINSKIISQLDHFFIHRFKYSYLEKIKPIINLHNSYYDKLPILNNGECVIIGSKLKTPLLTKVEKVKNT